MKRYIAIGAMWTAIIAGCCIGIVTIAKSEEWVIDHSRSGHSSVTTILRRGYVQPGPGIIHIQPQPLSDEERAEIEERDARWVAYCHPTKFWDDSNGGGVWRYRYSRPGCEYGRDRD